MIDSFSVVPQITRYKERIFHVYIVRLNYRQNIYPGIENLKEVSINWLCESPRGPF